ncbi:low molecular weight phosphotyrosine protein phosphatase [Alteromonas sp. 5E99-2]|uniref:low molecular weight protein-tyrosine-phosphatase n=1 Tax=Alteromonas sp. 5E99-2 TaxID=2817683 RepID=UPI001A995A81|nr:low molecular weight protein-tyrosine-phosphatase [Alteromonas sp. 5E99-2]MBO1256190.1 low molecular weight phosphotyrosine protein phosphatase [Alteromonas sp. 5E99-2]
MSFTKPSVLFVCLGNICRSPTAEAVFRHKAKEAGLDIEIDSAGTHGYHIGKAPDKRSQDVGKARGYSFKGVKCRRVDGSDFEKFDYILAMDDSNHEKLLEKSESEFHNKIMHLLDFTAHEDKEVPDPYYGGLKGFELVLDLIEEASDGLIKTIQKSD